MSEIQVLAGSMASEAERICPTPLPQLLVVGWQLWHL